MPWYSGDRGPVQLARALAGVATDVRHVRRGWHWDTPRTRRWLIQRGLLLPFTEVMAHPKVEGREWVTDLERPVIFAANHSSHADTSLILHALSDRARDRTVVAAA